MKTTGGYQLGITCCSCGGKLNVDEASHTISCPHCSSVLKIVRSSGIRKYVIVGGLAEHEVRFHIDRHMKKEGLPLPSRWRELQRIYVPFWRVIGTVFSLTTAPPEFRDQSYGTGAITTGESVDPGVTINTRDVSFCADEKFDWGVESLGVRTQILQLKPLEQEFYAANHLTQPSLTLEQAKDRFDEAITMAAITTADAGSDIRLTSVGLEGMLVYFPIWVANFSSAEGQMTARFDPLAKRIIACNRGAAEMPRDRASYTQDTATVKIILHRCPNCGHDLPDSERSVSYYCTNCRRLFAEAENDYRQLRVFIPQSHRPEDTLFPFWVFNLQSSVWPGKDDLMRAFRLTRFQCDVFYIPAFGLANPARLLRLVGHYNRRVNNFMFKDLPDEKNIFTDVTVPPEQAACLIIPLTAAAVVAAGYHMHDTPTSGKIDIPEPDLVWLPYAPDQYFWREQITGATIEKAAVL